jgi:peptidoglycan glycosyltransferase
MSAVSPPSPARPPARQSPPRRRRLASRALPLLALAAAAFAVGAIVGSRHEAKDRTIASRFARAWARSDERAMYRQLSARSRQAMSLKRFTRAYELAADVATLERIRLSGPVVKRADGVFDVRTQARTRVFGTLSSRMRIRIEGDEEATGVAWSRAMVFPALRPGEKLSRDVTMPPRAAIQARDGTVIADGAARTSTSPVAPEVRGTVGPIPPEQAEAYAALGYPKDAQVGLSGLERQFERRLAGTFGGTLRAGKRQIATAEPQRGGAVRTSIDLDVVGAAVTALAGRFGGIAVLRPRTGEVLGLAGIGYSAPQPPGSTFKIITLAGALDAKIVKPSATFPALTSTTLSGVELQNANGESCGGSLAISFAHSCNTVFAPLGARLGARRLVAAARRFGFDEETDILGAPTGSIPEPDAIGDDLAVGSSAIGQGLVTATPLRMAAVAAAIANHGELVRPSFLRGQRGRSSRATKASTARTIKRFMRLVVQSGTGAAAAIPGVKVAGKTGTAELRNTVPDPTATPDPTQPVDDKTDTDAWFVAFAPAAHPKVAVAVLLVGQGAGGESAAPAARVVLEAALKR